MTCNLSNKCAKNLCKQTGLVQLIIENVITCFGTQCRIPSNARVPSISRIRVIAYVSVLISFRLPILFILVLFLVHDNNTDRSYRWTLHCVMRYVWISVDCKRGVDCYTKREADECESASVNNVWFNQTCYNATRLADYNNYTSCLATASQNCTPDNWVLDQISHRTSATEEYFKCVLYNNILYNTNKNIIVVL